nr:hypothetical protein [Acidisphaera sp. S103]
MNPRRVEMPDLAYPHVKKSAFLRIPGLWIGFQTDAQSREGLAEFKKIAVRDHATVARDPHEAGPTQAVRGELAADQPRKIGNHKADFGSARNTVTLSAGRLAGTTRRRLL